MKKGTWIILGVIAAAGIFLWSKRSKADPADPADPPVPSKEPGIPDRSAVEKLKDAVGGVLRGGADPGAPIAISPGFGSVPAPGSLPSDPVPSSGLMPGFVGYFRVGEGDTLVRIARRLGLADRAWRSIRDQVENVWAAEQCPSWVNAQHYGGEPGIALLKRYAAPGWNSKLDVSAGGGVWPVLYWGGDL